MAVIKRCDAMRGLRSLDTNSVKLVVTSPPYHGKMGRYREDARGRNRNVRYTDQEWADWMLQVVTECTRVSSGWVIVIANGCVRKGRYIPSVERLAVQAHDCGIELERPLIWTKNSPPNRNKVWWANSWEYCFAFRDGSGDRPEFNWEILGHEPKYRNGGRFRQRNSRGERVAGNKYPDVKVVAPRDILYRKVGGGHMGSPLASEGEAPFPESIVEPFVLGLSNPGETVLDPFCGSGTTVSVAEKLGRRAVGLDNRQSQIDLTKKRLKELYKVLPSLSS